MLIVMGVALFMYKDGKSDGSGFSLGSGELLLLASLTLGQLKQSNFSIQTMFETF